MISIKTFGMFESVNDFKLTYNIQSVEEWNRVKGLYNDWSKLLKNFYSSIEHNLQLYHGIGYSIHKLDNLERSDRKTAMQIRSSILDSIEKFVDQLRNSKKIVEKYCYESPANIFNINGRPYSKIKLKNKEYVRIATSSPEYTLLRNYFNEKMRRWYYFEVVYLSFLKSFSRLIEKNDEEMLDEIELLVNKSLEQMSGKFMENLPKLD